MKYTFCRYWAALMVGSLCLVSCVSRKTYTYLQDVELAKQYSVEHDAQTKIQVGDRLRVKINSAYPELVAPFNGVGFVVATPGSTTNTAVRMDETTIREGYTVDANGYIEFPVLGKLLVQGKTLSEIRTLIRDRLVAGKYVPDADVLVVFDNFKIYLLGAIAKGASNATNVTQQRADFTPISGVDGGVLRIRERDRVNILEALALVGDLSQNARVDHVNIIRDNGEGRFVTYRINLKSVSLFQSPAFYLKQNDIVYVEYRYAERSLDRSLQLTNYFYSAITALVAVVALIRK